MSVFELARPNIRALVPYQSARRIGGQAQTFVNANEAGGLVNVGFDGAINRYPGAQPTELVADYASYCGLGPGQLLATRGADEGIEVLIRTFCEPGLDAILIQPPTYGMYAITAETCGIAVKTTVSLQEADLSETKLVFVCRPNNPTGEMMSAEDLENLLIRASGKALVVVDEAYIEFSEADSVASWIEDFPHLVVLRTFSKAFGMAGLRLGMVLANDEVIALLAKVLAPYPIPTPVAAIARQAMTEEGLAVMRDRVREVNALRLALVKDLEAKGYQVLPSSANFILVDDESLFDKLLAGGVLARRLSGKTRISIGSADEMAKVQEAIHG
ncbi:histidinol-phosphate transaminase [Gallaecimonas xiamenensis]|uniref:Histidinol-phosphate aminotransferase n=1 Tax=Gallaecimonas xiamenensis 3-C-1 TaxID=745411 RepID=K2J206_9GAMM|nr:histidinol-phosphate transaminase [Gallaecimonas xiamenensis]EKE69108.1 histidinol-phosphate aminotransferase [Gallaecimonas xiamenensis 3-C-1]